MVITRGQVRRSLPIIVRFFRRIQGINRTDPITLDTIKYPLFFHVTKTQTFAFHAPTLIQYIASTGDFRNPFTRQQFNVVEIRRLQKYSTIDLASTIFERQRKRQEDIARESLLTFLYSNCLSQVELCLDELTNLSQPASVISNRCLHGPCLEYVRSISQLVATSRRKALECVSETLDRLTTASGDPRIVYHPSVFLLVVDFFTNVSSQLQSNRRLIGPIPFRI